MNQKRAKALRRAVTAACATGAVPLETVYLQQQRTGVIRVGKCLRGLVQLLKKRQKKGIPMKQAVKPGDARVAVSGR